MTRIAARTEHLERAQTEIEDTIQDYLGMARDVGRIRDGLPTMPPENLSRISDALENAIADLIRLAFSLSEDAAAVGVTRRILEDEEDASIKVLGGVSAVLAQSYKIVAEVYDHARKRGISVAESAEELGGGKALEGLVGALSPERSASKGLLKAKLLGVAGIGLEFLSQWSKSDGGWDAIERTISSTGVSVGVGAVLGRLCARIPHLLGKGGCLITSAVLGGAAGDATTDFLFGRTGLTAAEKELAEASATISGFTQEEEERIERDAHDALMKAREDLVSELTAEGMSMEKAVTIAELNFPDYTGSLVP